MGQLGRRVDALEAIRRDIELRPYRRYAADHGVTLEEVLAATQEKQSLVSRLEAEGVPADEIMARCAEAWGIPLDELRAGCERIGERYFT